MGLLKLRVLAFSATCLWATIMPYFGLYLIDVLKFSASEAGVIQFVAPLLSFLGSTVLPSLGTAKAAPVIFITASWISMMALPYLQASSMISVARATGASASFAFFSAGVGPWVDATIMRSLGEANANRYGSVRAFATLAITVASPLSGYLMARRNDQRFESAFLLFSGACALSIATILSLDKVQDVQPKAAEKKISGSQTERMTLFTHMVSNPEIVLIFLVNVLSSLSRFGAAATLPFYCSKTLGLPSSFFGSVLLAGSLGELPVFLFGDRVSLFLSNMSKFRLSNLLLVVYSIAHVLLVSINSPLLSWWEKPALLRYVEIFQGAAFSLLWTSSLAIMQSQSPPHLLSTYIGLLSGLSFGLAISLSNGLTGYILEHHSVEHGFLAALPAAVMALVLSEWLYWRILPFKVQRYQKTRQKFEEKKEL